MLRSIKNFLFRGNIREESYNYVKSRVLTTNRMTMIILSGCATVLISIMMVVSFLVSGVSFNRIVYFIGTLLSVSIFLLSVFYAKKHPEATHVFVHIAYFVFYSYGILIGTVTDPSQKTATFIGILVLMPVLFTVKPIELITSTTIYVIIFIGLCCTAKTGGVLQTDIINGIIFGLLGIASGYIVGQRQIKSFEYEYILEVASHLDVLTQMNNRNHYEKSLSSIYDMSEKTISCIYIDVNGLHELNNEKGHEKGDEMLIYVAEKIKTFFGGDLSFRVGGDEFVVFAVDQHEEALRIRLRKMIHEIEKADYHVATGLVSVNSGSMSIEELVKLAEKRMFEEKQKYYQDSAHNRRRLK